MSVIERCPPAQHLCIAIPAYDYKVSCNTSLAITVATHELLRVGINATVMFEPGMALIELVRDRLATRFLRDTDATDILFLDADVSCPAEAFVRIAQSTRPFIGGAYPAKNDRKDKPAFPVLFDIPEVSLDEDGNFELPFVPAGFLRLNRAVFEAIETEEYGYVNEHGEQTALDYFNTRKGINKIHNRRMYIGEDYEFCMKWRDLGGKIHLIPDIDFIHMGTKFWDGNCLQTMREYTLEKAKRRA